MNDYLHRANALRNAEPHSMQTLASEPDKPLKERLVVLHRQCGIIIIIIYKYKVLPK